MKKPNHIFYIENALKLMLSLVFVLSASVLMVRPAEQDIVVFDCADLKVTIDRSLCGIDGRLDRIFLDIKVQNLSGFEVDGLEALIDYSEISAGAPLNAPIDNYIDNGGGTGVWTVPPLEAFGNEYGLDSQTLQIELEKPTLGCYTVNVKLEQTDPVQAKGWVGEMSFCSMVCIEETILKISLCADAEGSPCRGSKINYTLTVTNGGPCNFRLSDGTAIDLEILFDVTQLTDTILTNGPTDQYSSAVVEYPGLILWTDLSLDSGESDSITFQSCIACGGTIEVLAQVVSIGGEMVPSFVFILPDCCP